MKISKIIREYITETVNAKYQPHIDAIVEEYKGIANDYQAKRMEATAAIVRSAKNIWASYMACFYEKKAFEKMLANYTPYVPAPYGLNPAFAAERDDRIAKIEIERDTAIKNILIGLELGGTKADLDRMLAEVNP